MEEPDRAGGYLDVDRRGRVLVVTLRNPDRLNTYTGAGLKAVGEVWHELDDDPGLRAGVLTGAGERAFCAGADITTVGAGGFDDPPYPEVAEGLAAKPVVAAVNGLCLGGGLMIAAGCDIRVADERAEFGLPEARWNLPAQWLGALGRQMLPAHALELALWGDRRLPARRLYEMGWVNEIAPAGTVLDVAIDWAEQVAAMAPGAVRRFKELTRAAWYAPPDEALALGHRHARELMGMRDTVEGATAFAEKREPEFEDR